MDAVELARQKAAGINAALVASGVDPWNPMAVVHAAATQAGILEIMSLQAGSPFLGSSRARYDSQSSSIIHEATDSAFMNAFLIGHELGHAVLGDARLPDSVCEPDPSRSSEAAPDGEDRVADYSRRSRREVQMDLFSRELIMPRGFLREQHLAGMTAEQTASRLGAPYSAVAQQLLDALLLPSVEARVEREDTKPLNDEQAAAARHRGHAMLLEAGPGTGKTKTLVGRVMDLVERDEVDARRIVVLTYSNKAAEELSERIARRVPEAAAAMSIGTFHAFGLNLVRQLHSELGFDREPRLLDRAEAIEMMLEPIAALGLVHYRDLYDPTDKLRDLLGAVSRAQDEIVDPKEYAEHVERMAAAGSETLDGIEKAREVAVVYDAYSRLKRSLGRIDFGDLVALPAQLLTRRPDLAALIRRDVSHVLVDEYQDVNRASVGLLKALTNEGRNLWCVGDVRQSIYRFRGASSLNLARFDKGDFPHASRAQLIVNYRSSEEIVEAYSAFARDMNIMGATPVKLIADRGRSGHRPEFRHAEGTAEREIDAVADAIKELRSAGLSYREQALLCSGNDRLAKIGAGLEARGIPVLYLGSVFERPEVKDMLAWLSLLIDRRAMALARTTGVAGMTMPLADVALIAQTLADGATPPMGWASRPPPGLSPEGADVIERYARLLDGFDAASAPWDTLAALLLDRSQVAAAIGEADNMSARARGIALWQLMNFVRVQPSGGYGAIATMLDRIRRLVRLSDDRDLRHLPQAAGGIDAVRLMTMHGSKGLEFSAVHLTGMTKGSMPSAAKAPPCPAPEGMIRDSEGRGREITDREHRDERQCLFYVALSRARDRLILYSPSKDARGWARNPSVFVERLGSTIASRSIRPGNHAIGSDEPAVEVNFDGQPIFRQSELGIYERCPRRFFYTYVLRLGGRRMTTAYEDMHEIVRDVMAQLLADLGIARDTGRLATAIDLSWQRSALADREGASAYRPLVDELARRFAATLSDHAILPGQSLSFELAGARILAHFDYAYRASDGSLTLRQIHTGHYRKTTMEKAAAIASPTLAAQQHAGSPRTEMLYLSDAVTLSLDGDRSGIALRRTRLETIVRGIAAGRFPTNPSSRTCPKCPAFYTCSAVPVGPMEKNSY